MASNPKTVLQLPSRSKAPVLHKRVVSVSPYRRRMSVRICSSPLIRANALLTPVSQALDVSELKRQHFPQAVSSMLKRRKVGLGWITSRYERKRSWRNAQGPNGLERVHEQIQMQTFTASFSDLVRFPRDQSSGVNPIHFIILIWWNLDLLPSFTFINIAALQDAPFPSLLLLLLLHLVNICHLAPKTGFEWYYQETWFRRPQSSCY